MTATIESQDLGGEARRYVGTLSASDLDDDYLVPEAVRDAIDVLLAAVAAGKTVTVLGTEPAAVRPGSKLYGACGGAFYRAYFEKVVEATGVDWVVAREVGNDYPLLANCSPSDLAIYLEPEPD